MIDDSHSLPRQSLLEILFVIFLRLVAVSCFAFGMVYWGKLVGFSDGGAMRFDLMTAPWKVAASTLAVLFPVAALGLWHSVSWGPVLWFMAATGEVAMYNVWPELFGQRPIVTVVHVTIALCYILFRCAIWYQKHSAKTARKD